MSEDIFRLWSFRFLWINLFFEVSIVVGVVVGCYQIIESRKQTAALVQQNNLITQSIDSDAQQRRVELTVSLMQEVQDIIATKDVGESMGLLTIICESNQVGSFVGGDPVSIEGKTLSEEQRKQITNDAYKILNLFEQIAAAVEYDAADAKMSQVVFNSLPQHFDPIKPFIDTVRQSDPTAWELAEKFCNNLSALSGNSSPSPDLTSEAAEIAEP